MNFRTLMLVTVGMLLPFGTPAAAVDVQHGDLKISLPEAPTKDVKQIGGEDGSPPSLQHRLIINKTERLHYRLVPGLLGDDGPGTRIGRGSQIDRT